MSEWSDSLIETHLSQAGGSGTESFLADLLALQWRDPAICHLVGLYHLWRAVELQGQQQGVERYPEISRFERLLLGVELRCGTDDDVSPHGPRHL